MFGSNAKQREVARWLGGAALVLAGCASSAPSGTSGAPLCKRGGTEAEAFWRQVDVVEVRELTRWQGRPWLPQPQGAEVVLRPRAGQTAAHLERIAYCDARRAPEDAADPLTVSGVEVNVDRRGPTYVLRLTADDRSAAREIARRAGRLPVE